MNLRGIANRATGAINPNVSATLRRSTGYSTATNGKQIPGYAADTPISVQMQALTKKEIDHLDGMNFSNVTTGIYADVQLTGTDRTTGSGGDLVTIGGDTWLVIAVLEGWTVAGWCKAAIARQMPV